jgi:hypothetical protein
MTYRIAGEYVVNCNCQLVCPCGVDGPPTTKDKDGHCRGAQVLHITEGTKDGIDLANIDVGWVYELPSNVTAGQWTSALTFDPSVPDDKVSALEDIFMGRDGGPFGDFAPLIAAWKKTERAPVAFTSGKEAKGTIGKSSLSFQPLLGVDGAPTTMKNAMFGFAPEYEVGKGAGKISEQGISFEAVYGEHANFEFAS